MSVNPNEAPKGYIASPSSNCQGCGFDDPIFIGCLKDDTLTPCFARYRDDNTRVIFTLKPETNHVC